jgi:acyl carrier protein
MDDWCERIIVNSLEDVVELIENSIRRLRPELSSILSLDTPLIGSDRVLDSMNLVELCLILEDIAFDLGFSFDWTSTSAMSQTKSMFRNISALSESFYEQMNASK